MSVSPPPREAKNPFPGWPLLVLALALQVGAGAAGLAWFRALDVPMHGPSFGTTPWYFITQSFTSGICKLASLLVMAAILARVWTRYPLAARQAAILTWCFSSGGATQAIVIALSTRHLFDLPNATAPWPTFAAFQYAPSILVLPFVVLLAPTPWFLYDVWRRVRQRPR